MIRAIPDGRKLLEIQDDWNALIKRSSENPFLLSGFANQFMGLSRSNGWTPLILGISADDVFLGAAPLMTMKKFGIRFVKFLYKPWFSPDFILDHRYRETCIAHFLNFLFRTLTCQFVDISLPAESPNVRILKQECIAHKIHFWTEPTVGHRVIPTDFTWDEFKRQRSYNFRRLLKRMRRNLDRAGSWRTTCVGKGNRRSDAIRKIFDVERRSWKQAWRARRGMKVDPRLLPIWKGVQHTARTEPDFNWTVWFLELEDRTLAYTLVLEYKKTAFIVKTSFDERYRRLQPGLFITNEAIRELFNKGKVKKIDWLTDLPFQRNWTETSLPRVRVMMSGSSVIRTVVGSVFRSAYTQNVRASIAAIANPLLKRTSTIGNIISS